MIQAHQTQAEARSEFVAYFNALREEMKRDGATVNRYTEWASFVAHKIEEGVLPESAQSWPCPRG